MATSGTTIQLPTNGEVAQSRPAGRRGRTIAPIVHRTPAEHAAEGEAASRRMSHALHAGFEPASDRRVVKVRIALGPADAKRVANLSHQEVEVHIAP